MLLSKNILKFFELIKTESFVDETEANDPNVHIKLSDKVGLLGETHGASQVVLMVKNLPANAGDIRDMSSVPALGRSPGEGHDNPLQCSCQKNPVDREAWRATVQLQRVGHD